MQERTRNTILIGLCFLFIVLLGVWWYFGFSLDFMRFFAAEPDAIPTSQVPPPGCHYEQVQCIQAPCPPQLVCPSCQPRPACLDATPSCDIAEPAEGWCPPEIPGMVKCAPVTQTVRVGQAAAVSATSGAGLYTWYAPEGTPPGSSDGSVPGATFTVSYAVAGTKKVTVQSPRTVNGVNDPANQIIDSVACTVIVTP